MEKEKWDLTQSLKNAPTRDLPGSFRDNVTKKEIATAILRHCKTSAEQYKELFGKRKKK